MYEENIISYLKEQHNELKYHNPWIDQENWHLEWTFPSWESTPKEGKGKQETPTENRR